MKPVGRCLRGGGPALGRGTWTPITGFPFVPADGLPACTPTATAAAKPGEGKSRRSAPAYMYFVDRTNIFGIWKNTLLGNSLLFLPVLLLFCPVLFPISLCLQKNPEEDSSGKTLSWEPGHLLLTIYTVRSIEQLLPFFNVLSQVFNSKVTSRCVGHSGSPVLYPNCFPSKDIKMENLKTFSSKARQKIEEMVEKDFLEGVIKT